MPACFNNCMTFRKKNFIIYKINHILNADIRKMAEQETPRPPSHMEIPIQQQCIDQFPL